MGFKERRRSPRVAMDLPVEYRVFNSEYAHAGIIVNASETGFQIRSVKDIPKGTVLSMAAFFPKGYGLEGLGLLAEVVWKDYTWEEHWEGYHYGVSFLQIENQDLEKLKCLLGDRTLKKDQQSGEVFDERREFTNPQG